MFSFDRPAIIPSVKLDFFLPFGFPFNLFRVLIDACWYTKEVLLLFDMTLIKNRDDIKPENFPDNLALYDTIVASFDAGAKVWRRDSWFLAEPTPENVLVYYIVQIIDGSGAVIEPAYSAWQQQTGTVYFRDYEPSR